MEATEAGVAFGADEGLFLRVREEVGFEVMMAREGLGTVHAGVIFLAAGGGGGEGGCRGEGGRGGSVRGKVEVVGVEGGERRGVGS